ncbi:hypothetical protein JET68_12480 [Pseudomonas monteilii]|uniref:hypothetical protein n=1 Tax=Pseudomonas TaxID=286 RepID=UPI0018E686D3|nr:MULTISPECIES: hypothetical protein [Pseudomonas]MBI6919624.1 hypothetical protein [Pseudomonas monteilii]MCE0939185.1 hypothetical protein [Pseudomonas kurunegalensis]
MSVDDSSLSVLVQLAVLSGIYAYFLNFEDCCSGNHLKQWRQTGGCLTAALDVKLSSPQQWTGDLA